MEGLVEERAVDGGEKGTGRSLPARVVRGVRRYRSESDRWRALNRRRLSSWACRWEACRCGRAGGSRCAAG